MLQAFRSCSLSLASKSLRKAGIDCDAAGQAELAISINGGVSVSGIDRTGINFAGLKGYASDLHFCSLRFLMSLVPAPQRIHPPPQTHGEVPRPIGHVAHLALQTGPLDIHRLRRDDLMNLQGLQHR